MADRGIKNIISVHFFLLSTYILLCASVEGRTLKQITQKHKHAIKTIRTEHGDIVDCVSLYKQPALDNPLLKNHKIQMRPSWNLEKLKKDVFESENSEAYAQQEIVHCPEGTIPILRTPKSISQLNPNATTKLFGNKVGVKDAYFWLSGSEGYTGMESSINVWKPQVAADQDTSGVSMWLQAGSYNVEIVGAGWMVNPREYHDYETRLTAYWTTDNFRRKGCLNLDCPGFCQVDTSVTLGGPLKPSIYNSTWQESIQLAITKDKSSGNWWLQYNDVWVGYWPKRLFSETGLGSGPSYLAWGGKVFDSGHFPGPTYTQMGSGHFPYEGYERACYIRSLKVTNRDYGASAPNLNDLQPQVTNRTCYDASKGYNGQSGPYIFLGGDGANNPSCH